VFHAERAKQSDLEKPDFAPLCVQVLDRFLHGFRGRTHHDDDAIGIGCTDVFKESVLAAGELRELVHRVLHHIGGGLVVFVDRLASSEVDVGILAGSANLRAFRAESTPSVGMHEVGRYHLPHDVVAEFLDLLDFVRSAETVEKMQKRNA
jgi:hypothetical protein